MATTLWGNVNTQEVGEVYGEQVYFTYNVTQTGAKYDISIQSGIKATTKAINIPASTGQYAGFGHEVSVQVFLGDPGWFSTKVASYASGGGNAYYLANGSTRQHINTTYSIEKNKWSSLSIKMTALSYVGSLASLKDKGSSVSYTFQVPTRESYTISYNANGGTGDAPTSPIIKWADESIILPDNTFTRVGYDFVGWATISSGGTIYPAGGTYTGNANTIFYAIWKSNYVAPTIFNFTAYRSNSSGTGDDEGYYASIQFNYTEPELDYSIYSSYAIKVGVKQQGTSTYTYTTVTGTDGAVFVIMPNIDTEHAYDIIAVIETTGFSDVSRTTYVSQAYYVMDINSQGTAVGFFMAVQDGFNGLYIDGNEYLGFDTSAASGTDKEIYDALVSLGWDDEVIV